jgi:hypothetical protein
MPAWVAADPAPSVGFRLLSFGTDTELERTARALADQFAGAVAYERSTARRRGFLLLRPDGFVAASGSTTAELARLGARLAATVTAPPKIVAMPDSAPHT